MAMFRFLFCFGQAGPSRATSIRNGGRDHLGMVGDIKSERWARSFRNSGRHRAESASRGPQPSLNRYSDGAGPRAAVLIRTAKYFKLGRNDSSWGFLVVSIRRSYLRKPSHRPVNILPNARREVSSGPQMPGTEAVLQANSKKRNHGLPVGASR